MLPQGSVRSFSVEELHLPAADVDQAVVATLTARLCCPSAPLPHSQVYWKLVNPSHLLEEFNHAKPNRRTARLRNALRFLRRHNVLLHSLLFYVPATRTWNTTAEFARLALYGESVLTLEVRARLLKLFPDLSSSVFAAFAQQLLSEASIVRLFDSLEGTQLVGSRPPSTQVRVKSKHMGITADQKRRMLYAMVGEMKWFASRTKATDRTHNNAIFPPSDVLIMHVLCSHICESLPAELIFRGLSSHLDRLRQIWVNEPMSLPSQLMMKPRTISALSLSAAPHACTSAELSHRTRGADTALRGAVPLLTAPNKDFIKSHMQLQQSMRHFNSTWYAVGEAEKRGAPPVLSEGPTSSREAEVPWSATRHRELMSAAVDGPEEGQA